MQKLEQRLSALERRSVSTPSGIVVVRRGEATQDAIKRSGTTCKSVILIPAKNT